MTEHPAASVHRVPRMRWDAVTFALLATIVIGSILRFAGIMWGLPMLLHGDEAVIVDNAIDMIRRNSFEPAFFMRPDHLEIQLGSLAYQVWAHVFNGASPLALFAADPAPFYAISRGIVALFGSGMIVLAYLIGRPFSRPAGLWMAVAVAVFPPFVEHSRYATPDIPLTFTVMVVILGCVLYIRGGSWWVLVLACAGVALGITVKYPAALGSIMVAAAVIIDAATTRRPWRIAIRGAASAGMVVAMTFLLSPVLFTNGAEVVRQLSAQNSDQHLGASGLNGAGNLGFYATQFLSHGGVTMVAFAAVGIVWAILARREDAVPLLLGGVYWLALSSLALHWDRWGLPMYLSVVLLAGLGFYGAWAASGRLGRSRTVVRWTVAVVASLTVLSLILGSCMQLAYAQAEDTRVASTRGIADLGATIENTAFDGYTPINPSGPGSVIQDLTVRDDAVVPRNPDRRLEYVLTSSNMVDRYLADSRRPEEQLLYTTIAETLPVETTWDSVGEAPPGPWVIDRLIGSVGYLIELAAGGLVGPDIVLYRLAG
ncbi:MAG TPA: glycosyltransferase family 39 protein [Microbacterium sp.]|nr:glycosyltransferase family 39 protein [Microbacterium sp.]